MTGTSSKIPEGAAGGHGYQGDADTGLMLLGHRYYDPSTGRFLTRDPAKDGRNWYAYCDNNPLESVDPTGNSPVKWILKIWHGGQEIVYHIIPGLGRRPAKTYAKGLQDGAEVVEHAGHNKGPQHFHNEGVHQIHVTSEGLADEAAGGLGGPPLRDK